MTPESVLEQKGFPAALRHAVVYVPAHRKADAAENQQGGERFEQDGDYPRLHR